MKFGSSMIFSLLCLTIYCVVTTQAQGGNPKGYDQLIDAIDAAYVRVIESNEYFDFVETAGLTNLNLLVTDCYWGEGGDDIDVLFPYPDKPKGILRDIIQNGEIKYGNIATPFPGPYGIFLDLLFGAIVDRLEVEYGVTIVRTEVNPNSFSNNENFANLLSGDIDVLYPIASLGGVFENPATPGTMVRRTKEFLHSCSVAANDFSIWTNAAQPFLSLQDARSVSTSLTVCYNINNGGITRSNFPEAAILEPQFANVANACAALVSADPTGNTIALMEFDLPASATQVTVFPANQASPTAYWVKQP